MSEHLGKSSWWGSINLLALALIFAPAACRSVATPPPARDPQETPTKSRAPTGTKEGGCPPEAWTIELHREGGIMGLSQSLNVTSAGKALARDLQAQKSFNQVLDTSQISEINELLAQACPFESHKTVQTCADCFVYDLSLRTDQEVFRVQATDMAVPQDMQPLVQFLNGLLAQMIAA